MTLEYWVANHEGKDFKLIGGWTRAIFLGRNILRKKKISTDLLTNYSIKWDLSRGKGVEEEGTFGKFCPLLMSVYISEA